MELVRAFTTRQPAVGSSAAGGGTTLQRHITIYVLVAGIAGGLFLVMTILLLCKYCKRSRSFRFGCLKGAGSRSQNHLAAKPIDDNKEAETSFIREKINNNASSSGRAGVEVLPRRSSVGHTSKQKKSSAGPSQTTASSPAALLALPHHTTGLEPGSTGIRDSPADGTTNDSYVIQVEPIRVIAASPLPDDFSWVSDDSQKQHGRLTVKADITTENWKRLGRDSSPGSANRRSLQHAASHPTSSQDSSSVSKRRSDWRNSHRNYRSTPTSTTASRDAHNVNVLVTYEARRALRDSGPSSTPTADLSGSSYSGSPSTGSSSTRRLLPKRAGSMRENPGEHLQQRSGGPRNSPSNKRWRCNTVDYPSSPGPLNPAGIISKEMLIMESESSLSCQRHSFPNSGDQPAIHQSRHQQSQHHRQHSGARPKELFYDMNHSESLDWIGFQGNRRESIGHDDENDDTEDASISQQSTLTAGPAPKITIRYNDPGSLESVNEDNLFFCLEADNKKEFRQRLEKTIHAQYRQVWELRANLEEHNEFYELPSSPEPEMINIGDAEMPSVRHSASFDSNPEILPDEVTEAQDLINTSHLTDGELTNNKTPGLLYPTTSSGMWKRQSYRSIAINSRHQRLQHNLQTSPNNQPQSSFDSIDTIETSSTDASRLDQVTTSFESSATDSTNGPEQTAQQHQQSSGVNRMLASRGDSGYKSLESSAIPTNRPRLAKSLATTRSEGGTLDYISHPDCQCEGDLHDEKCERDKPIVFARCTRYGLAKSRSASTGGGGNMFLQPPSPAPPPAPVSQPVVGWKQQPRRLPTMLARDYSIDERTDALFREFSRCDPVYDGTVTRQPTFGRKDLLRPAGFNRNRWINQQRHEHHQHRFLSLQSSDQTAGGVTTSTDGSDVPLLQQHSLKE